MDNTETPSTYDSKPLDLVVVGGVAGGMSFAARARRLSEKAQITVLEKGPYVGYANCGIPYALGGIISSDDNLILQTPESIKARYDVYVRTNTEVVKIDRARKKIQFRRNGLEGKIDKVIEMEEMNYDTLVLAQGAEAFRPGIKGEDGENVFALQTIPDLKAVRKYIVEHDCKNVAIIGGGFIGLEAADSLRALSMNVSIVEYMPHVFPPVDQDIANKIHAELQRNGVSLYLNARIQEIGTSRVLLESGQTIPADVILTVVGVRPRLSLARSAGLAVDDRLGVLTNSHMQSISDPNIYCIGDMACTTNRITHQPQNLALAGPANRQGRLVADHLFGRPVSYRGNVGTSVCKVFNISVGLVGPSVTNLRAMGMTDEIEYVTVHPPHHAGYFPGAVPMTLKLAFSTNKDDQGRILGAQCIGHAGVDKRIDVLATSIQADMTVFDLEHLELAYAPPFNSAKDPINMAGFVASNVLSGHVSIVHAEHLTPESLAAYQIIDVRSPSEFQTGHMKGAMSIPLDQLRRRIAAGEIDTGRKVLVYCLVGYRGYLAYRILVQEGFEVVNLDGGFKAVVNGGYDGLVAGLS